LTKSWSPKANAAASIISSFSYSFDINGKLSFCLFIFCDDDDTVCLSRQFLKEEQREYRPCEKILRPGMLVRLYDQIQHPLPFWIAFLHVFFLFQPCAGNRFRTCLVVLLAVGVLLVLFLRH